MRIKRISLYRPLLRASLSKHASLRIAAVAAASILAGCSKAPEADPRIEPPAVVTAPVVRTTASVRRFTGVVAARVQSNLGFRVNGKIIQRLVDVGQIVKRG